MVTAVSTALLILPMVSPAISPVPELPDLIVTNLRNVPAFPLEEEPVLNRGTGPLEPDKAWHVSFRVNGEPVATSPLRAAPIPVGGMTMICGSETPHGKPHWAATPGTYSVDAVVDVLQGIPETIESNNSTTMVRSVRPRPAIASKP